MGFLTGRMSGTYSIVQLVLVRPSDARGILAIGLVVYGSIAKRNKL